MITLKLKGRINDQGQIELEQSTHLPAGEVVRVIIEALTDSPDSTDLPDALRNTLQQRSYLEGARWFETNYSRLAGEDMAVIKSLAGTAGLEQGYSAADFIGGAIDAFCQLI